MMNILVGISNEYQNGKTNYKTIDVLVDTKQITLRVVNDSLRPNFNYVEVKVNNAMQRAYRSISGKQFKNFNEALNNYKDKKVVAAIKATIEFLNYSNNPATAQA